MDTKVISLHFNAVESILSMKKGGNEFVNVNYSADVDFTELIEKLSYEINDNISICIDDFAIYQEGLTPKERLIFQTLQSIIKSYNNSFIQESNGVEISPSQNNDDLPF